MSEANTVFLQNFRWLVRDACDKSESAASLWKYENIRFNLFQVIEFCIDEFDDVSYPNIEFFGSKTFGLSHNNSDLDIAIDTGDSDVDRNYANYLLTLVRDNLDHDWEIKILIRDATVPVLKVLYRPFNLNCDIVANGLGVANSRLIKHLFDIQPEARSFYHFIRMWLNTFDLKFRSYTLTLLVIFYLQKLNLMPTVEKVQRLCHEETFIEGWNVAFNPNNNIMCYGTRKMRNYQNHLQDFFDFYAEFDFGSDVISTFHGKEILRHIYAWDTFKINRPMCVAGPINRAYNCSYGVGVKRLQKFVGICRKSSYILRDEL